MIMDEVRSYWNRRPCNIRHSKQPIGSIEYFDEVELRKYAVEPHIPAFAEFGKWRGKKVLEIGCGIGTDAVSFARAGAHYTGVDISGSSIALARERFNRYGLSGSFLIGDAQALTALPLPHNTYDLVYAFGVIHHCPMPQEVVDRIARCMDNTSEFRLMLYAKNSWKNIMIQAGFDQSEAQDNCPVAYTYTEAEARTLLKDFNILSLRQDHIFTYDVDKYVRYEYEELPWFAAMPTAVFKALENALGWHMLICCKLKST